MTETERTLKPVLAKLGAVLNAFGSFFTVIIAHDEGLGGRFSPIGDGGVLLAAACFAVGSTYGKKCGSIVETLRLVVFQMLLGSIVLIAVGLALGGSIRFDNIPGVLLTLYLGLATIMANGLWMRLLQTNTISSITVFNFLIPVFGAILSSLLLKEDIFKLSGLAGLLLTCGGIFIVNYRREGNHV